MDWSDIEHLWIIQPSSSGVKGWVDYCHVDYDGPEDNRCGFAKSHEEAIETILDLYY